MHTHGWLGAHPRMNRVVMEQRCRLLNPKQSWQRFVHNQPTWLLLAEFAETPPSTQCQRPTIHCMGCRRWPRMTSYPLLRRLPWSNLHYQIVLWDWLETLALQVLNSRFFDPLYLAGHGQSWNKRYQLISTAIAVVFSLLNHTCWRVECYIPCHNALHSIAHSWTTVAVCFFLTDIYGPLSHIKSGSNWVKHM